MFNLDPAKLLVIAVVAVILLGPDRLPQVARQVSAAWRSFQDYRHRMETQVRSALPDLPSSTEIARLARSPSALLNHLSSMSPGSDDRSDSLSRAAVAIPHSESAALPSRAPDGPPPSVSPKPGPRVSPEPSELADPGLN